MRKLIAPICFLLMIQYGVVLRAQPKPRVIPLREQQLRDRVIVEVLPNYPRQALKDKSSGIVVMQVEFDREGLITSVETVEAADLRFVPVTERALKKWRFRPIIAPDGTIGGGKGKLTFYFFWKDGRGWSANPWIFDKNRKAQGTTNE